VTCGRHRGLAGASPPLQKGSAPWFRRKTGERPMCQHAASAKEKASARAPLKDGTCQNQNQNRERRLLLRHLHASATRVRFDVTMLVDADPSRVHTSPTRSAHVETHNNTSRNCEHRTRSGASSCAMCRCNTLHNRRCRHRLRRSKHLRHKLSRTHQLGSG